MLAILTLILGTSSVAYADVIDSGHTVTTNVVTNPCDSADGLIVTGTVPGSLTTTIHCVG